MREWIASRDNPALKLIRKLRIDKKERQTQGLFLCEGGILLEEALTHGADIVTVVCVENRTLPALPPFVRVLDVSESLMRGLLDSKSFHDLIFTCRLPFWPQPTLRSGRHLLLDAVQDPGNVGSILRTASAFGVDSVLLTPGCADPFAPKTIRAGMGAVFRQRVFEIDDAALLTRASPIATYAASRRSDATHPRATSFPRDFLLLLGNEGAGLSPDLLLLARHALWIPLAPSCESLGVAAAAAILLYAMT